eukprot:6657708-Prymnesium_polylepis.1
MMLAAGEVFPVPDVLNCSFLRESGATRCCEGTSPRPCVRTGLYAHSPSAGQPQHRTRFSSQYDWQEANCAHRVNGGPLHLTPDRVAA